jgi:pimeloyl-ACP methyl ester carboxylesterase
VENAETTGTFDGPAGSIAWRRLGSGPPLLLINGYAATKDDWDPGFLAALARTATVVCPDNRGVGESDPEPGELSVGSMAVDMAALLDDLDWETADVVGWSMGGFVAQQLAADAPERVSRLVLLGTDPGGADALHAMGDAFRRLIDHSGTPHEQARRLLDLLFPPDLAAGIYAEFGDLVAAARAALDPEALTAQEGAMSAWAAGSNVERIAAVRSPVLAAAGAADVVIPAENAARLAGLYPDAWLARFPGCGHAFMAQEPDRLAALIAAFLHH